MYCNTTTDNVWLFLFHPSGSSFTEWFTSYVHNVVTGEYPIIRDQIFRYCCHNSMSFATAYAIVITMSIMCLCYCLRYVHDKQCVATTGDITVSVSTSFLPELSSVHPPHFFFTYRIRYLTHNEPCPVLPHLASVTSWGFWNPRKVDQLAWWTHSKYYWEK